MPAVLLVLALLAPSVLPAQPSGRLEKTLLWEVTGNGVAGRSYLYGTMHLQSRRVFDLSDSVLIALRSCRVFMPEADMDSLGTEMFRMLFHGDTTVDLKKLLSPERYNELDTELQASIGLPIEQARHMKPWMVAFLKQPKVSDADRPAFLDAWLGRVARLEGLRLVGLESVAEQMSTFDGLSFDDLDARSGSKDDAASLDTLVNMYAEGDLEGIARMVDGSQSDTLNEVMLTRRNHRMIGRIETMMRSEPAFVAVGAAHLVGQEGLIALLRARGYQVRPVRMVRTGLARSYVPPKRDLLWHHFADSTLGYALDVPAEPVELPFASAPGMSIGLRLSADLGAGTYYSFAGVNVSSLASGNDETLLNAMVTGMLMRKGFSLVAQHPVPVEGGAGKELEVKQDALKGGRLWARVLVRGGKAYIISATVPFAARRTEDVDRFFSSFTLLGEPTARGIAGWREITIPDGAFSVTMPGDTATSDVELPESVREVMNFHVLQNHDGSVAAGYYDFKADKEVFDDSAYLARVVDGSLPIAGPSRKVIRSVMVQGYPGMDAWAYGTNGMVLRLRTVLRGNRGYSFVAAAPPGGDTAALTRFVESVRFIEPREATWRAVAVDSLGFSALLPAIPTMVDIAGSDEASADDSPFASGHVLYARDTGSSLVYLVAATRLPRYAWLADSSFLDLQLPGFADPADSLIERSAFTVGASPVVDRIYQRARGHGLMRVRVMLVGRNAVMAVLVAPEREMRGATVDRFFRSVVPNDSTLGTELFVDRTAEILRDARSSDTAVASEARAVLKRINPSERDLPAIVALLSRPRPDDASETGMRRLLLLGLVADTDTIGQAAIAEGIAPLLPTMSAVPDLRREALNVLLAAGSDSALSAAVRDLRTPGSDTLVDEMLSGFLENAIKGTTALYPELFAGVDRLRDPVPMLRLALAWADSVPGASLAPHAGVLARAAAGVLSRVGNDADDQSAIAIAGRVLVRLPRTDSLVAVLRGLERSDNPTVHMIAIGGLLTFNEPVDGKVIGKIAADPEWRGSLHDLLVKLGKESLMPARFRAATSLAESVLHGRIGLDVTMTAAGERDDRVAGTSYRAVIFKVRFPNDQTSYPCVVYLPKSGNGIGRTAEAVIWLGQDAFSSGDIQKYVVAGRSAFEEEEE